MKVAPTLEGGLRIDVEDPIEWELFRSIITDTQACDQDLASRLSGLITPEAGEEDWHEYIVPDLREGFLDELNLVDAAIEAASHQSPEGIGSIWITPADGMAWYSALNQARLALEEHYHFAADELTDISQMTMTKRTAFMRDRFYAQLQIWLLDEVMR